MEAKTIDSKITIEAAITLADKYCSEIRANLELRSPILDLDCVLKIEKEWERIKTGKEPAYFYYEIGRKFIVEHLVASLKKDIGLRDDESNNEERTLREVMGRVYHSPPKEDELMRAKAARDMNAKYGEARSRQIFDALVAETKKLKQSISDQKHVTEVQDMFFNTLQIYPGLDCDSFSELASWIEDIAKLGDKTGYDSIYS